MEAKFIILAAFMLLGLLIWLYAALVVSKDEPLEINARDRYKNL